MPVCLAPAHRPRGCSLEVAIDCTVNWMGVATEKEEAENVRGDFATFRERNVKLGFVNTERLHLSVIVWIFLQIDSCICILLSNKDK